MLPPFGTLARCLSLALALALVRMHARSLSLSIRPSLSLSLRILRHVNFNCLLSRRIAHHCSVIGEMLSPLRYLRVFPSVSAGVSIAERARGHWSTPRWDSTPGCVEYSSFRANRQDVHSIPNHGLVNANRNAHANGRHKDSPIQFSMIPGWVACFLVVNLLFEVDHMIAC